MKGRKQAQKLKQRQNAFNLVHKKQGFKQPGSLNPKKQKG